MPKPKLNQNVAPSTSPYRPLCLAETRQQIAERAGHLSGEPLDTAVDVIWSSVLDKKLKAVPDQEHVDAFNEQYKESTTKIYGKAGDSMKSEMKALGSYRYAIVNIAANSLLDLFAIQQDAAEKLPFQWA